MVELLSATSLIGKASKAISSAVKLKDKGEILEAIIPIQEMLRDALIQSTTDREAIHALTLEKQDLTDRIRKFEKQEIDRDKYELHIFQRGTHAWRLKESEAGDYEYICPTCLEEGKKSGLQKSGVALSCPACRFQIQTETRSNVTFSKPRTSFDT